MFTFLAILCVIVALLLILVVIVQNSKGGGLSSTFGASNASQILGARRSNEAIEKITWYLALGLAAISFIANIYLPRAGDDLEQLRMQQSIENQIIQQPTEIPTLPEAPAEEATGTEE